MVASEGTSVLPYPSPWQAAPLLLQAMPRPQGFRRKFNSPLEITGKDCGSACGRWGTVGGWAGFWGTLRPLSLHPVVCLHWGSPSLCSWTLLGQPQGKPVVDNLERRKQLSGSGTVMASGGQAEVAQSSKNQDFLCSLGSCHPRVQGDICVTSFVASC